MHIYKKMALTGLTVIIAGCGSSPLIENFSEPTANNIAVQTRNPEAGKKPVLHTLDGPKAEKVITRYRQEDAKASTEELVKDLD